MAPRRNLEETKRMILDAGAAMLAEGGFSPRSANISLIDACRRAGLGTAGSGYKIWANQDDFRDDVMHHALAMESTRTAVADRLLVAIAELGPDPSLSDLIRVTANENAAEVIGADWFIRLVALWLAAATDDELRHESIEAQQRVIDSLQGPFGELLTAYGRAPRPPFTIEMITLAIAAETHGLGYYGAYDDRRVTTVQRPTGRGGEPEQWHLLGCVVEAIVEAMTEPVDAGDDDSAD